MDAQIPFEINDSKAHDEVALSMAEKSMTLLKNDGTLPLNKSKIKKIAVIGPNAGSIVALRGNYHGTATNPVTIVDGIKNAVAVGVEVTYHKGISLVTNKNKDSLVLSNQILKDVINADVAIFVGGLDAELEGEEMNKRVEGFLGGDRTKIELPETQLNALKAMKQTGTPIVFVLMAGSAVSFNGLEQELEAILATWYPGQRGGDAVANVLFGDYNPAGRLPVTFYNSTKDLPDFTDYNMRAGKGFTYRYHNGDVLYPFGHGLSYSQFEYTNIQRSKNSISRTDEFTVSVEIKNTGKVDGEEVVQLYIKDVQSDKWMARKQLRKFERIALRKGETKTVVFKLNTDKDLRYYDALERQYMVEPGDFEIQIGCSSEDVRLKGIVTIEK